MYFVDSSLLFPTVKEFLNFKQLMTLLQEFNAFFETQYI